jgi:hypothetical protein
VSDTDYPNHTEQTLLWEYTPSLGLVPSFWDDTIDFLKKTRMLKMKMQLSFADLLALTELGADGLPNIARKKRIRDLNFLIKTVDVQLTMDRIETADVEFYLAE